MLNRFLILMLAIAVCFFAPSAASAKSFSERAADLAAITGLRISVQDQKVRIVLDADRPMKFKTAVLTSPSRVLIDIENAWLSPNVNKEHTFISSYAEKVRIAQFNPKTVRVVVTTNMGKDKRSIFTLEGGSSPGRLVMDFGNVNDAVGDKDTKSSKNTKDKQDKKTDTKEKTGASDPKETDKKQIDEGPSESERLLEYYRRRREQKGDIDEQLALMTSLSGCIITIDPGHGGNDSGAIGPTGVMEKTVTLAIAKELRKLLQKEGATVHMTRTRDTEVSPKGAKATDIEELQARCDVANKNKSHVFISIHADSFTNNTAKGTTGYYYAMGSKRSRELADKVRVGLIDQINTVSRGTQSCNFYVVKHTDMAATLVEVAFISNREEEKLMNSEDGVKRAAQGIADGIADFFG